MLPCISFLWKCCALRSNVTLQQELEQAHCYNGHDHEDDNSDDDDEDVPQREGEPEEWMLLCRLNQHFADTVS